MRIVTSLLVEAVIYGMHIDIRYLNCYLVSCVQRNLWATKWLLMVFITNISSETRNVMENYCGVYWMLRIQLQKENKSNFLSHSGPG